MSRNKRKHRVGGKRADAAHLCSHGPNISAKSFASLTGTAQKRAAPYLER